MSMKYLLVIGLALAVFFLWRYNRQAEKKAAFELRRRPDPATVVTEIVACSVCQVHLPQSEAVAGALGFYCCEAHRRQAAD